jgi:zinc resistance-associated protein
LKEIAMWKAALAGTIVLTLAGSTLIYAQDHSPDRVHRGHFYMSAEDRAALVDARVAALKAGLRLTPDQDPKWAPFEQALRNFSKVRGERREARRNEAPASDPVERLQRRADATTKVGAALKQLSDATTPLYQSLNESQKRRFLILARFLHHKHGRHWSSHQYDGRDEQPR